MKNQMAGFSGFQTRLRLKVFWRLR